MYSFIVKQLMIEYVSHVFLEVGATLMHRTVYIAVPIWCQGAKHGCVKPADIGTFDMGEYQECQYKCQAMSCLSARFDAGKCYLSSQRCGPDEIGPVSGLYFHRLSK